MSWEAWFTLSVVVGCIGLLSLNRIAPDIIMMAGVTLLLAFGVLTPEKALSGLANEGLVTVAVLFIVVAGLRDTGGIQWISRTLLTQPSGLRSALIRLMVPTALLSALLNNTPIVAMLIPAVQDWSKRIQIPASKLLIPLSYAAIIGGTSTLIGTSTNLVVNGLLISETGQSLGMFTLAWIGLPLTLLVFLFVWLLSDRLLPTRQSFLSQAKRVREYTLEMLVDAQGPLIGQTVEEAGLRQLPNLFLVEIERDQDVLAAVSPKERLQAGDRLIFAGVIDSIRDICNMRGLIPATDQVFKLDSAHHERCLVEVVISNNFPLLRKTIRNSRFRTIYDAVIIAVARNGRRINKKIGDIDLRAGDTLVLVTHKSFIKRYYNARDFLLLNQIDNSKPLQHDKAFISVGIMGVMVLLVATGMLPMVTAVMLAAGMMLITRCTNGASARQSVDWQLLIVIAASFGIGQAMQTTGAAQFIAEWMLSGVENAPLMALAIIFLTTALFTAAVTNNAAAVLMFPIALATANKLEVNLMPFAVTIMVAASTSFATPIGYQTNLMVYGPGGYRFTDYLRMGLPLTLLVGLVTLLIVPLIWPFSV